VTTPVIDDVSRVSAPVRTPSPQVTVPAWAKLKGFVVGLIVEVPVFTAVLWAGGHVGGLARSEFVPLMRLVASFSGIAALVTAIGVGRTAAYASVERGGGRWRSVRWASATHAVAGIGLAVIAGVAAGLFTPQRATWITIAAAGGIAGAVCGAMIGLVCGGPSPISASDLVALAKRPTDIFVHAVIDPASGLVRMGGRVADRAGHAASELVEGLVDGLFDPAAPPPPNSMTDLPVAKSDDVSNDQVLPTKPNTDK
jgi:hypothetical protein